MLATSSSQIPAIEAKGPSASESDANEKIRVEILANPVLVEVLRGETVESEHRGAVFVVDAAGKAALEIGDTDRPVYPRSAVKAIQALPLVESGAADAYGFGDRELALACA